MWFNITEEEHKKIMKERSLAAEKALLKEKQKNCSHKNSYVWEGVGTIMIYGTDVEIVDMSGMSDGYDD